jgi:hypothetical protein
MAFTADEFTGVKVRHIRSDFDHLADELMPYNHRHWNGRASPVVPLIDMKVGPADSGQENAYEDIVDADDRGGNVFEPETTLRPAFHKRFHKRFKIQERGAIRKATGTAVA